MYYVYRLGYFLANILPVKALYLFTDLCSVFYYLFSKKDNNIMKRNIRVITGPDACDRDVNRIRFQVYRNFAKYLADFFRTPVFTEKFIEDNFEIIGEDRIEKALSVIDSKKLPNFNEIDEIRKIFLEPKITDKYRLQWSSINNEKVIKILCDEHHFKRERVEQTLIKFAYLKNMIKQKTLF